MRSGIISKPAAKADNVNYICQIAVKIVLNDVGTAVWINYLGYQKGVAGVFVINVGRQQAGILDAGQLDDAGVAGVAKCDRVAGRIGPGGEEKITESSARD